MLLAANQFGAPTYDLVRSHLGLFGVLLVMSGAALVAVHARPTTPLRLVRAAHLAVVPAFLGVAVSVLAAPVHWTDVGYWLGFGALTVALPWVGPQLRAIDPQALRMQLSVLVALLVSFPLIVAMAVDGALHAERDAAARDATYGFVLLAVGAAVAASIWMGNRFAQPLRDLAEAVRVIAEDEHASVASPHGPATELARLARDFDDMRARFGERTALLAGLSLTNARLHREAHQALLARDRFLSIAAHELNTPVTSMLGFTQLALRQVRHNEIDASRLDAALTRVERQAVKLTRMIAQLLDLSRLETGELQLERHRIDVAALVRRAVEDIQLAGVRCPIVVSAPSRLEAWVDPIRVEQVVTNLVSNAVKFSPAESAVHVELAAHGNTMLRLAVRDHGPGIPAEHGESIFRAFHQVQPTDVRSGLGLGLFVSSEIVRHHGGTLAVEHPADGGAQFTLLLPSCAHSDAPDPSAWSISATGDAPAARTSAGGEAPTS
ncbi:MAG: HAMP domain-containing histidine kinase [Chloroflexi bacterium]|nr:HAMP domain-containing histidine kinase [Chloroflexota bacterium]